MRRRHTGPELIYGKGPARYWLGFGFILGRTRKVAPPRRSRILGKWFCGFRVGYVLPDGASSIEYDAAMIWNFILLKQDRILPFTVSLPGAIRKMLVVDESLSSLNLIRTGTGYSVGIELFRYTPIAYRKYLRMGLTADLNSSMYLAEEISGSTDAGYPKTESLFDASYGVLLGLS